MYGLHNCIGDDSANRVLINVQATSYNRKTNLCANVLIQALLRTASKEEETPSQCQQRKAAVQKNLSPKPIPSPLVRHLLLNSPPGANPVIITISRIDSPVVLLGQLLNICPRRAQTALLGRRSRRRSGGGGAGAAAGLGVAQGCGAVVQFVGALHAGVVLFCFGFD
jgi:hypothetical protein